MDRDLHRSATGVFRVVSVALAVAGLTAGERNQNITQKLTVVVTRSTGKQGGATKSSSQARNASTGGHWFQANFRSDGGQFFQLRPIERLVKAPRAWESGNTKSPAQHLPVWRCRPGWHLRPIERTPGLATSRIRSRFRCASSAGLPLGKLGAFRGHIKKS